MYDPSTIRAAIVTILKTITQLAFVYDYPNANPEGYPCAILDMDADDGKYLDQNTNVHTITFKIWIIQEITIVGQDTAISQLDTACKYVIPALEKISNMSLGGSVIWTEPTSGGRKQTQTENGPVFYKEVILKCNVTSAIQ